MKHLVGRIKTYYSINPVMFILFSFTLVFFIVGCVIPLRQLILSLMGIGVDNYWSMYSGITIPATIITFLLEEKKKNDTSKKLISERIITSLDYFLSESADITEHLYVHLNLNLSDINSLGLDYNRKIYKLLYSFHTLNSLSKKASDDRRNYVMRLKLNNIFEMLFSYLRKESEVTREIPIRPNQSKNPNGDMREETERIYNNQLRYLKTLAGEKNQKRIIKLVKSEMENVAY